MLIAYLKLCMRLMARSAYFSFVNIAGLSVGLGMFFILWTYTAGELHSDQQWRDSHRIYRFGVTAKWSDDKLNWEEAPFGTNIPVFVDRVVSLYPEIVDMTRILHQLNIAGEGNARSFVLEHGPELYLSVRSIRGRTALKETGLVYADPNVFTFFGMELVQGDPETALNLARSVVLSERSARRYFGELDIVGKTIMINDKIPLVVTGVMKDLPHNSHLNFDIVVSSAGLTDRYAADNSNLKAPVCYVKLGDRVSSEAFGARMKKELDPGMGQVLFGDWPFGAGSVFLQPLCDMPFQSFRLDFYPVKSRFSLVILQAAAVAILILAWINYVNLARAAHRRRVKEVATRTMIGASTRQIAVQFMVEAIVMNGISCLLAVTLIQLVRHPFETIFGIFVPKWNDINISSWAILSASFLAGITLTGLYPALMSVRHHPSGLLRMKSARPGIFNKAPLLSTFQYSVAIVIVVLSFAMYEQLEFIFSRDIGLSKEEILVVDLPVTRGKSFRMDLQRFVDKLGSFQATVSQSVPGDQSQGFLNLIQVGVGAGIMVESNGGVDENFVPVYEIGMLVGRNFLPDHPADKFAILVSASTVSRLGFGNIQEALGTVVMGGVGEDIPLTIIGVFADYRTSPLLNVGYLISPGLVLTNRDIVLPGEPLSVPNKVSLRITTDELKRVMGDIEAAYRDSFGEGLFHWNFFDEGVKAKYRQVVLIRNQLSLFSAIAVGIAYLGLFGMIMHKASTRVKEIGIRKILGAGLYQICYMLLRDTAVHVMVAIVLGLPLAAYLVQHFLNLFSDRIELQWRHFASPVVLLVTIMMATVASSVWRAAGSNPVEALKHE